MILDSVTPALPEDPVDICVVGSGPAGAIAAVELARAGLRVALLEAGGEARGLDPRQGIGELDVGGAAETAFGRALQLGGSTNLWAGRLASLTPEDFLPRPGVPLSGWPVAYEEVKPFYDRAVDLLGSAEMPAGIVPAGFECLFEEPGIEARPFVWAPAPFRARDWLRRQAKQLSNLSIVVDARCTSFRQDSGGCVAAARVLRPDGSQGEVLARRFVLAAGGLEVVRTLFNSTDRCPDGLGNERDVLGRYFSTHPKADIGILRFEEAMRPHGPVLTDARLAGGRFRLGIGLDAQTQYEAGSLNHYVQLTPIAEYRASRAFEMVKGRAARASPLLRRQPAMHGFLAGLGLWAFDVAGRAARLQPRARLAVVRGFFDQLPDANNRVTRSYRRDAAGVPCVDVHWRFSASDRASVMAFLDHLAQAMTKTGLGRLDISALRTTEPWELTALHSHFMGATRMGTDPRHSVTDADGRVHTAPNLYIAGPSLFPTYGYANPMMTIAALAIRTAERIVADLRPGRAGAVRRLEPSGQY